MAHRVHALWVMILFGIWASLSLSNHFSDQPIPDDISERSLHYLDRVLSLEEIAKTQPEIIKATVFSSDYDEMLGEARNSLEALADEELLDETGQRALAVMREELGEDFSDLQIDETTAAILNDEPVDEDEVNSFADQLPPGSVKWWDAKIAAKALVSGEHPRFGEIFTKHESESRRLFNIELVCAFSYWALLFGGLIFLPHSIRVVRRGWKEASSHRPIRYGSRWNPSLVLTILIGGELLAIGLLYGGYIAASPIGESFFIDVALDSLWRITAPVIALFILYRRPSHAVRSLGLDRRPDWKLVFAAFAVISWAILGFNTLTERWISFDPTGGLDPMENGWAGLFYGILSACILAPIAEEIFYRGVLFRGLTRHTRFWIAAAITTFAFVIAHSYDLFGLATIGIFGFIVLVVYRTTGSLATAIALHALYNFTITLPSWLVYQANW